MEQTKVLRLNMKSSSINSKSTGKWYQPKWNSQSATFLKRTHSLILHHRNSPRKLNTWQKKLDVPRFSVPSDNRAATRLSSEMPESSCNPRTTQTDVMEEQPDSWRHSSTDHSADGAAGSQPDQMFSARLSEILIFPSFSLPQVSKQSLKSQLASIWKLPITSSENRENKVLIQNDHLLLLTLKQTNINNLSVSDVTAFNTLCRFLNFYYDSLESD